MKTYNELRTLNVNEHTEKKGQLTYLSWTYAVDTLLQNDPSATWNFSPPMIYNDTIMVRVEVTAFGKTMQMQLPVMDNRNQAIKAPDARKVSDAQMRCLAKCIACFGIGLYIYAGEDLPIEEAPQPIALDTQEADEMLQRLRDSAMLGSKALKDTFTKIPKSELKEAIWKKHSADLKKAADQVDLAVTA